MDVLPALQQNLLHSPQQRHNLHQEVLVYEAITAAVRAPSLLLQLEGDVAGQSRELAVECTSGNVLRGSTKLHVQLLLSTL